MNRAVKTVKGIILILWGLVLVVIMYWAAIQHVSGEQTPQILGFRLAAAGSGSMEAVFSSGDLNIYRKAPSYQVGDIVLFQQDGSLITHRIIEKKDGQFQTRGDANSTADQEMVPNENVLGKLILVLPHLGNVVLFLKTPPGMLLMTEGILVIIWVPHLRNKKDE